MIPKALFHEEVQAYLETHQDTRISKFILKGSPFPLLSVQQLAQQLEGKRKAKTKLPLWYSTPGIIFPPKLNLEQTSSAATALYKAQRMEGQTLADGTGGFGIDGYYFAQYISAVAHIEMNEELSAFAQANFKALNTENIQCIVGNSMDYFAQCDIHYDTIYLDPGRRTDAKGKVFMLQDCLPNVPKHLEMLLTRCNTLWIKTAPMLDLSAGLRELKAVSQIHIVSVKNEVKELLWKINSRSGETEIEIVAVNLNGTKDTTVHIPYVAIQTAQAHYSEPSQYLYEPMASLMKAGAFQWISQEYQLEKLQEHSHLYTSNKLVDFPGRRFKIHRVLPYSKSFVKDTGILKANITTRNFPLTVATLRKKLKIKEGGKDYLFFTTLENLNKIIIVCEKL